MASKKIKLKHDTLSQFNVHTYPTLGGGHCFFHAVSNAFYLSYRQGQLDGRPISRHELVKKLRMELADKLEQTNPDTGLTYYHELSNGNVADLGLSLPEYSLAGVKHHLMSDEPIGDHVCHYVSQVLKKAIYILDILKEDVYVMADLPNPDYPAVVIGYHHGHFELCGLVEGDQHTTYFSPRHPFILAIRSRLQSLKSAS